MLIRAEIRRRGLHAIGIGSLGEAAGLAPSREEVGAILIDREIARRASRRTVERVRELFHDIPILLLAGPDEEAAPGPWDAIVRRPTTIPETVRRIEELMARARPAHRAAG